MRYSGLTITVREGVHVSQLWRADLDRFRAGDELLDVDRFEKLAGFYYRQGRIDIEGEPSIGKKAANFGRAVLRHVATAGKKVPESVRRERITICRGCELYNKAKGTCRHPRCGCVMQRKARWASTDCPIGLWGRFYEGEK